MHSNAITFVLFVAGFTVVSAQIFCSDLLKHNRTKFYPVRHCQRSNQTRIAARNVANLAKCIQFTEHHQGLAFNFGHGKRPRKKSDQNDLLNLYDVMREKELKAKNETKFTKNHTDAEEQLEPYFNCEVLSCPEVGNMSLINDTRYDYYTLYGNGKFEKGSIFLNLLIEHFGFFFGLAPQNATCFPTVGLFIYYYEERMNYTKATSTCTDHRGHLAQILSDERTNFLSYLIQQRTIDLGKTSVIIESTTDDGSEPSLKPPPKIPIRHAFVGLSEFQRHGNFIDSFNVPLKCYRYRAWTPNYPM